MHKNLIVACARIASTTGRAKTEIFRTGATTGELLKLAEWLKAREVRQVVMEATGVYWKPVWHVLEEDFELVLANAQHVKAVPGRKSDVNDAQWLAELLAHGLVRGSIVPPQPQRELRDLTRTRKQLTREIARHTQRLQKVLEDGNVKLDSVVSSVLGAAGRRILEAMAAGETDLEKLVELRGRLHASPDVLREALRGRVTDHHRFLLRLHLTQITAVENAVADVERRIEQLLEPFRECIERLNEVPGFSDRIIASLLAEVGTDLVRFPSSAHAVSWVGLCPALNESAGKKNSTRLRHGNIWLKTDLCQAAVTAKNSKNSYLRARYHRLRARRGAAKAIVAVAATLLRIAFHIIRDGVRYKDLGPNYYDAIHTARATHRLTKRLEALGYAVTLRPAEAS